MSLPLRDLLFIILQTHRFLSVPVYSTLALAWLLLRSQEDVLAPDLDSHVNTSDLPKVLPIHAFYLSTISFTALAVI